MSAWYVFAAMGIFPQTPGRAELLLAGPVFPKAVIIRGNGVRMTITARSGEDTDGFVQSAGLDGAPWTRSWLPESFVQRGGTLTVTLGAQPRIGWATEPGDLPKDHVRR
jgi:putative alpha-1,2-mannosidase